MIDFGGLGLWKLVFGLLVLKINFRNLNVANPVPALRDGKDNLKNTLLVSSADPDAHWSY